MKHMVSGFRRSLSLPTGHHKPLSTRQHFRSISLPCHFHPFVSQLDADLQALRAWLQTDTAISPLDGLTHLSHIHATIDNMLYLPHALDTLRCLAAPWIDRLLDDFLRLADAYYIFRSTIITLRQHQSSTHAAIRRRDDACIASCIRNQRRAEQDLSRLASSVRERPKTTVASRRVQCNSATEAEMMGIMTEAVAATFAASGILFFAIAGASSSAVKKGVVGPLFGRRVGREDDEGRLEEMMECMTVLEEKSEGVFRSLINSRVSLLNIVSQTL